MEISTIISCKKKAEREGMTLSYFMQSNTCIIIKIQFQFIPKHKEYDVRCVWRSYIPNTYVLTNKLSRDHVIFSRE